MMNDMGYFFTLAGESFAVGFGILPFIALPAIVGLLVALCMDSHRPEAMKGQWKWLLLPFLIPMLILLYGVIFRYQGHGDPPDSRSRLLILAILVGSHLPLAILFTVIMRRNIMVPLGISTFQAWLSISAALPAGVSVTGDWL